MTNLKKFPQGVPEISRSREWDGREVTVTLTLCPLTTKIYSKSNQFILESTPTLVPNLKKFPRGVPEKSCSQEWIGRTFRPRLSPVRRHKKSKRGGVRSLHFEVQFLSSVRKEIKRI